MGKQQRGRVCALETGKKDEQRKGREGRREGISRLETETRRERRAWRPGCACIPRVRPGGRWLD